MTVFNGFGAPGRIVREFTRKFTQGSTLVAALAVAFQPMMVDLAYAQQIIIDPNGNVGFNPTLQGGSQAPVVNIATPNSGGVSHNQYDSFNVTPSGVVLNNSQNSVKTQVAGSIAGNPNLTFGTASTILNEVTSTRNSGLMGTIEVAGSRANVIIANPNGVTCDGCSFINTNNATLTTGQPVVNGATITLNVETGTVRIGRGGLDGKQTGLKGVNLVGRAVVVDGKLTAVRGATVSGGAQTFNMASGTATARSGSGGRPAYAVDATAFGAMRAGDITIIGNESGLGVRMQGDMQAGSGDLTVRSAGDLELASGQSAGDLSISAAGVYTQTRDFSSQGSISLTASSFSGEERSGLYATDFINVSAANGLAFSGQIQTFSGLTLNTSQDLDFGGFVIAQEDIAFSAGGDLLLDSGVLFGYGIDFEVGGLTDFESGYLALSTPGQGAINITTTDFHLTDGVGINLPGQTTVVASGDFINEADMRSFDGIDLTYGGNLENSGIFYGADLVMNSSGWIYNEGVIYGGTTLSLTAVGLENTATGVIYGGSTTLALGQDVINDGTITAETDLTITAQNIDNSNSIRSDDQMAITLAGNAYNDGEITAGGHFNFTAQTLENDGLVSSTGTAVFDVATLENNASGTLGAGDLDLTVGSLFSNEGTISVQNTGVITADGLENIGTISAASDLAFALGATDLLNSGLIESGGLFDLDANELVNSGSVVVASAEFTLADAIDNTGVINASDALTIDTLQIDNSGSIVGLGSILANVATTQNSGLIYSDGLVDYQGDNFIQTATGELGAGTADLEFATLFSNAGDIRFDADGTIDADEILTSGEVSAGGVLTLNGATEITIAGVTSGEGGLYVDTIDLAVLASGELSGDTGLIDASASIVNDGTIYFSSQGQVVSPVITNNGDMGAGIGLAIVANTLDNAGLMMAATLDVDADTLTNQASGTIGGGVGEFTLVTSLINDGLISLSASADITTIDVVNNGTLSAENSLTIVASNNITNTGDLASNDVMTLDAGDLFSNAGQVYSDNSFDLVSASFTNQATGTISGTAGDIDTGTMENFGQIVLSQDLLVTTNSLTNTGALVGNQALTIDAIGGTVTNAGLLQGDALTLDTDTLAILTGGELFAQDATLTLVNQMTNDGFVQTENDLILASAGLANAGVMSVGGIFDASFGTSSLTNSGTIEVVSAFDLTAQNLDNSGSIAAGESLITLAGSFDNSGIYQHVSDFTLTAASFENSGDLFAPGAINIDVTGVADLGGNFASGTELTVLADQIIGTTSGTMSVGTDLLLDSATTIELGVATVVGGDAFLTTANGGPIIVNDRLQAQLVTLESQDVTIGANGVVAGNHLDLLGTNILNIAGEVSVNSLDPLTQSQIMISGAVYTRDSLTIDSADVTVASGGIVGAGYLSNTSSVADLIVNVDNLVIDGSLAATRDVTINRRDGALLSVNGQLYAGNVLDVTAGALSFGAGGGAHAGLDTTLTSLTGDIDFAGSGSAGANFVLASARDITLTGTGGSSPDIEAGLLDIDAVRDLTSSSWTASTFAELDAGRDIVLSGRTDAFNATNTAGYAAITAGNSLTQGGTINTAGVLILDSATSLTNSGTVKASQIDVIVNNTFTNTGSLSATDALYVDAINASVTPDIINHGTLAANNFLSLRGTSIDNRSGGRIQGGDLQINSATWLNNAGLIDAGTSGALDLTVAGVLTNSGSLKGEVVNASAGGGFNLSNSSFIGGDAVLLFTNNNTILRGDIRGNSAVLVNVGNADLTTYGDIWAGNGGSYQLASNQTITGVNLIAGEWEHKSGAEIESRSDIFVDADDRAVIDGTVDALGDIVILANYNGSSQSGRADLTIGGNINGGTTTLLVTNDILSSSGNINGQDAVTIEATTLRNGSNTNFMDLVASGGDLSLTLDQGLTLGSGDSLEVGGDLMLALTGNIVVNNGTLRAGGDLIVSTQSGSFLNTYGVIKSGDDMALIASSGDLINRGGTIEAGGNMSIEAQDIENGEQLTNTISTEKVIEIGGQQYDYATVVAHGQQLYSNFVVGDYGFDQRSMPARVDINTTMSVLLRDHYGAQIPFFVDLNRMSATDNFGSAEFLSGNGQRIGYNGPFDDTWVYNNTDTRIVERTGFLGTGLGPSYIIAGGNLHVDATSFTNVDATVSVGGNAQFDVTSSFKNVRLDYAGTTTYFNDRMKRPRRCGIFNCHLYWDFDHRQTAGPAIVGADPQSTLIAVDGNLVINGASGSVNTTTTQTSTNVGGLSVVNTGIIQASSVLIVGQQITTGVGGSPSGQNVGSSGANLNNNNVAANYNDGRNGVSTANYNGPTSGVSGPSTVNGTGITAGNVSQVATASNPNVGPLSNVLAAAAASVIAAPGAVAMNGPANINQSPFATPDLGSAPVNPEPDFAGTFFDQSSPIVSVITDLGLTGDADTFAASQAEQMANLIGAQTQYLDGQWDSAEDQYKGLSSITGAVNSSYSGASLGQSSGQTPATSLDPSLDWYVETAKDDEIVQGPAQYIDPTTISGAIIAENGVTLIADYIDIGADITAGGDLNITAYEDLKFTSFQTTNTYSGSGDIGGSFANGDAAATQAMFDDRNLNGQDSNSRYSLTMDDKYDYGTGGRGSHEITETLTTVVNLNIGGNVQLTSHGNATFEGTQIDAGGNISISAAGNIVADAAHDIIKTSHSWEKSGFFSKSSYSRETMDVLNTPLVLTSANGNVSMSAGNDIISAGTEFNAANGTVALHATNNIFAGTYRDISHFEEDKSSSSLFGLISSSSDFDQTIEDQTGNTLFGQHGLELTAANGDANLIAPHLNTTGELTITTGGDLNLASAVDSTKSSLITMDNNGITITSITETENVGVADFGSMEYASLNLNVGGQTNLITHNGNIEDAVGLEGQMAETFIPDLWQAFNPDDVTTYGLIDDYYYDKSVALNPAFKALMVMIATPYLGGLGLGNLFSGASMAVQTGMTAFGNQLALGVMEGVITGDLDMDDVFKNAVMSGLTAGISQGLTEAFNIENLSTDVIDGLSIGDQTVSLDTLINGFADNVIEAGVGSIINGTDFGESLLQAVLSDSVNYVQAGAQNIIGAKFDEGSFGSIVSHGVVGCLTSEALQGSCGSGAAAGIAQAIFAGYGAAGLTDEQQQNQAQLLGTVVGYALSGGNPSNVTIAGNIAKSAIKNNRQLHRSEEEWAEDYAEAFAAERGITKQEALQVLRGELLRGVSDNYAHIEYDPEARAFINANAPIGGPVDGQNLFVELDRNSVEYLNSRQNFATASEFIDAYEDLPPPLIYAASGQQIEVFPGATRFQLAYSASLDANYFGPMRDVNLTWEGMEQDAAAANLYLLEGLGRLKRAAETGEGLLPGVSINEARALLDSVSGPVLTMVTLNRLSTNPDAIVEIRADMTDEEIGMAMLGSEIGDDILAELLSGNGTTMRSLRNGLSELGAQGRNNFLATNSGRLTGNPARTTSSDPEAIRGIARENEAAQNLANNGFDVVQNPGTLPNGKTPDLRLNGEIYDVVSPSSNRVRNLGSRIEGKVESGQTQNVVVNLADTTITPSQLTQQLRDYPVSGLQSVVIIDRSGSVLPPVRFD